MKNLYFILVGLCLVSPSVNAQNKNLEKYHQRILRNFNKYRDNINKKYADYLRGIWEKYEAYSPLAIPDDDIPPVIYDKNDSTVIDKIPIDKDDLLVIKQKEGEQTQPRPIDLEKDDKDDLPVIEDKKEERDSRTVAIPFYGTNILVHSPSSAFRLRGVSNEEVADMWESLESNTLYHSIIRDCLSAKAAYRLCDWAYLNFVQETANILTDKDNNTATVLAAYLLQKSGYKILLGRSNNLLHLLFASEHEIYERCYYNIDNVKYYSLLHPNGIGYMDICNVPNEDMKEFSLYINKEQLFNSDNLQERDMQVSQKQYVSLKINKHLLDFYSSYPTSRINEDDMTRWAMYAQTPMNGNTRELLYSQLSSLLAGKTELEAANLLLNYVQTSFVYEYDDKVWGKDRAFFAEESLAYPYCDCEDRSILFSHLMRDLLNLDVALVYSPGHMFTAVRFNEETSGAYFMIHNEKYVICEPTCTNGAPVGWSAVKEGCTGIRLILLSKIDYGKNYQLPKQEVCFQCSLFPIQINGKYGYRNKEGEIVVPCEYDSLIDSEQGDNFLYGAVKSNKITLYDSDGVEHLKDIDGYIPLKLNKFEDGMKGDYYAIAKYDGQWHYINLVWGPLEDDFCFDDYDMDNVSYDKHIYCVPQGKDAKITDKFIILKQKASNKWGVLRFGIAQTFIPFEYDEISFVNGDKSKVKVYDSKINEHKVIKLE